MTFTIRLPVTVAATALLRVHTRGPFILALPGTTRAGLTLIWAGGVLVGGSFGGGGGVLLRVLVNTHSHVSPASTWTMPSLSAAPPCALSTQVRLES